MIKIPLKAFAWLQAQDSGASCKRTRTQSQRVPETRTGSRATGGVGGDEHWLRLSAPLKQETYSTCLPSLTKTSNATNR